MNSRRRIQLSQGLKTGLNLAHWKVVGCELHPKRTSRLTISLTREWLGPADIASLIRAMVSRRQLAIAACHGGGEHREQEEQGRFCPEVAADTTDGVRRRSKSGIAFERITPANYRHRWGYREQGDDEEGRDLRPEEYVDPVIGPAFGRNGSPDEANDDNHAGKDAVPVIDTADADDFVALYVQGHGADLEGENAGKLEHQQVMHDRQH